MLLKASRALGHVISHLKEVAGLGTSSLDGFRIELESLGLLGKPFAPCDYARALEDRLQIRVVMEEFPDLSAALTRGEALKEGILAEVSYNEDLKEAVVLVRESLRYRPWPAHELKIYHELSHLAAGHSVKATAGGSKGRSVRLPRSLRSARPTPVFRGGSGEEIERLRREVYEPEARRRAGWLVFAGTFPEEFEMEGIDQVT